MTDSNIEWTDKTWNVLRGCSRVSAGCEHCYAEAVAARFSGPGLAYEGLARRRSNGQPQWTGVVQFVESKLLEPLKWQRPARVFVNSMSDLFHENVSDETIARIWQVMAEAERHTFQILTKRPERMLRWFNEYLPDACSGEQPAPIWPLPNVHLGVSIEDQRAAHERIPILLQTPAAVRFLSVEPLLSAVDLWFCLQDDAYVDRRGAPLIDWVICGGESGIGARPCDVAWITSIVADCELAGVPCFVKQMGAAPIVGNLTHWRCGADLLPDSSGYALKLRSKKGGDPSEWPEELRVREFPAVRS